MNRDSSDSTRSTASPPVPEKNNRFKTSLFAKDGSSPLPQTVAHRGYKKLYPENSLAAFQGAIDVGSHGIETDLQLSRDGVVVISHDPSLKRCFGVDKLIIDCDWEYLSTLRTTKQPHEKLPRLSDLLDFLNSPCAEHAWVLLDIKRNNDAKTMIHKIAETLASVPPGSSRPWSDRIILGCWAVRALSLQTVTAR
ncbi:PLC-like phosphodiesterase [Talaromyces proteolyticus]|uniref:PLC-like phosphodiesterase n=1 Tax=Talaromyces proteolyticus TaxID=1131652 RepID=A0AAD4KS78_9EURO|nr:PLC-like phosphodiesterase [Talaromyces proteolyticus]KAH8694865.1 PLC-like phosphodiesterase [Talaromyces proteolyticus]